MTKLDFEQFLQRFAAQPTPATSARHLYVWQDTFNQLAAVMPPSLGAQMDLYALTVSLVRKPQTFDEARRMLRRAIQLWLHDYGRAEQKQLAIIVTGIWLLVRYRPSLHDFVQAASDRCMVVFVAPRTETEFAPLRPLPSYVTINPASALEFLLAALNPIVVGGNTRA
jgi:hypothetical protein